MANIIINTFTMILAFTVQITSLLQENRINNVANVLYMNFRVSVPFLQ